MCCSVLRAGAFVQCVRMLAGVCWQGIAGNGENCVICVVDRVLLGYANQGARDGRLGRRKLRSKLWPAGKL